MRAASSTPAKPERGIRRTPSGWQAIVQVGGKYHSKHFPPDQLVQARGWRAKELHRHKYPEDTIRHVADGAPTFPADVTRYLPLIANLVSYPDRKYRLSQWQTFFGAKPRNEITAVDIRRGLEHFRRKHNLAPATLNLYRSDLMHLWYVLDGKSATNPVLDVPAYSVPRKTWKLPTWAEAEKVIGAVQGAKSKAQLSVLLWTGWPSAQLSRLTKADVDLKRHLARLAGREKGKGTPAQTLPLLPQAVEALKAFDKANAYGPVNKDTLLQALHRACDRVTVPRFRVYDLRHLFLTTAAIAIQDDRVVAVLGMHRDIKMTQRYTAQSVDPRVKAGIQKLRAAFR